MKAIKQECISCGDKNSKKQKYLFEDKIYCADCLLDIFANKGNIFFECTDEITKVKI